MLLTSLVLVRPAEATAPTTHSAPANKIHSAPPKDTRRACPPPTKHHQFSCSSLISTTKSNLAAPPVGRAADPAAFQPPYSPLALQAAYNLPSGSNGQGQTVAVVDAYDSPNLESDLDVYRNHFNLPPCTTGNGCFQKLNQNGAQGPYPSADSGWGSEEALDVDMVSAICPNCHIILVEANSTNYPDFTAAEQTAVQSGAKFVSNSFGGTDPVPVGSGPDPWHNHDGVVVTASTGDWGYGVYYPAAYSNTVAVGGTSILPAANLRGWSEITWTDGGSGCSTEPKPSWQSDTGCAGHTLSDVSAVANPYTGVAVYDTDPSINGWAMVGGTSASSPIIASVYALAGTPGSAPGASVLYGRKDHLNDIVAGINTPDGCTPTYLCKAGPGYDGPTGLGTPDGIGAFRPASSVPTDYTIMGDSYSSGEGLGSYDGGTDSASNQCHRSPLAFGRLYATAVDDIAVHTACSGATIDNITTTGQGGENPQLAQVNPNSSLVTVTIGGNDAGFASVLTRCLNPLTGSCEDYYNQDDDNNEDNVIDALEPKLAAAYTAIRNKAPNARVVAMTYPNLFKPLSTCDGVLNASFSDMQWLIGETGQLDNVIVRAAHDAGIDVLDERYAFVGHEVCSSDPWVYSLPGPLPSGTGVTDSNAWFHPTQEGHLALENDLSAHLGQSQTTQLRPYAWTETVQLPGLPTTAQAQQMLADLATYSAIPNGTNDYKNSDPSLWTWTTRQGCNTRQRILRTQALANTLKPPTPTPQTSWKGLCPVTAGTWELPYDNGTSQQTATYSTAPDIANGIEIDHIVPKKEGWNSGLWALAQNGFPKVIKDFTNDDKAPELWAVSATTNAQKQESRPDQWMPDNTGVYCTYIKAWVAVKYKWELAVLTTPDPNNIYSEKDVLQNVLNGCP
jgi:hypothetical protein